MVTIEPQAVTFINELLQKNEKTGFGIKIYLSGHACSGPQFGMTFQEKAEENDTVDNSAGDFEIYYDEETKEALQGCVIQFIDDPNFGTGLAINDPNFSGCSSCGGGCH